MSKEQFEAKTADFAQLFVQAEVASAHAEVSDSPGDIAWAGHLEKEAKEAVYQYLQEWRSYMDS